MERVWVKNYHEGVPAEINPDTYSSLVAMFEQTCKQNRKQSAYSNIGSVITFAELDKKTRDFAAYLQNVLHLQKGDRFAIMMPNLLQYPVALFGALRAGLVVVNVNPLYTASELEHIINDSGSKAIVVLANFANVVNEALPKTQTTLKHIIVTEVGDLFSPLKRWLVNFIVKHVKKLVPNLAIKDVIPFNSVLQEGSKLQLNPVAIQHEDVAFLQYTGGTTGISKGAILTHRNMVANVMQLLAWVKPALSPEGRNVVVTALPLYHIFSLTVNCLTFTALGGLNILITNPRDIPHFIKEIKKLKFTAISGVNTLFNALLNNPEFATVDFSRLRLCIAGGMAVQKAVADKWQKVVGSPLIEGYGLTEASPVVTANPLDIDQFTGSIGLPIPSTEITIRDENGNEVEFGTPGELWVRGPQVMPGYWHNAKESSIEITADGWLKTGDIAKESKEGYFYIVDRKKDMIIVSGFNVYPNEIEDVIAKYPGVLEVAVVGVSDEHSGEAVKAFIVKKDPNLTADEIIEYCHKLLTRYKVPKEIEFRTDLPKTNVGKILRRALRT